MKKEEGQACDLIGEIIQKWNNVDPSFDTSGTEIIGRIVRLNSIISRYVDENLGDYRLNVGEFDVLAALIREENKQLAPGKLQEMIMISSGGLTNRINRLEARHLIVRKPDPNDRRGVIVELTKEGEALILKSLPTHLAVERKLAESLTAKEQKQLSRLLKKMLFTEEATLIAKK